MNGDKPHREGEVGGKFCFSESSSRHWVSFLLPCEAQITFLIITDGLSPVLPVVHEHKWMAWPPLLWGGAAVAALVAEDHAHFGGQGFGRPCHGVVAQG